MFPWRLEAASDDLPILLTFMKGFEGRRLIWEYGTFLLDMLYSGGGPSARVDPALGVERAVGRKDIWFFVE
jgi:hypothetical protein